MALRFVWPLGHTARGAPAAEVAPAAEANLLRAAREDPQQLLARLNSGADGLSNLQSQLRLARLGPNQIARQQPVSWFKQLLATFRNPLVALLAAMAALSLLSGDRKAALIIGTMIVFSVSLRFSQEYRSLRAA